MMLAGEGDVSFGGFTWSDQTSEDDSTIDSYAFFSGNTLYAGANDEWGNSVDSIVEFFWFESSIDRGSDFFVAVIKARTSPAVDQDWYLETSDAPVLSVVAETNVAAGDQGFRWDWSVPFENYGIDSCGEATLETAYGLGTSAEGSALLSETIDEDGYTVQGTVQSKGYLSSEYRVQTMYQVSLYEWNVDVTGRADEMGWDMWLNTSLRDDQNAYHEYFLAMQVEEDGSFMIDTLDISGAFDYWTWYFGKSEVGIMLTDVMLTRPQAYDPSTDDDSGDTDWTSDDNEYGDTKWDSSGDLETDTDIDTEDDADAEADADLEDEEETGPSEVPVGSGVTQVDSSVGVFGCQSAPMLPGALMSLLAGLVAVGRRRQI